MVIFEKEDVNKLVTLAAFLSCKGKIKMVTYINESCWLVSLKPPILISICTNWFKISSNYGK